MVEEKKSNLLRVSLLSMSERSRQTMTIFFETLCKDLCVLSEHDHAHVSVADLDHQPGKEAWETFRQEYPKRPAIVLSLQPVQAEGALFVGKPVNPVALRASLERIKSKLIEARRVRKTRRKDAAGNRPSSTGTGDKNTASNSVPPAKAAAGENRRQAGLGARHKADSDDVRTTHGAAAALTEYQRLQVGTLPDIDPRIPADLAKVQYQPERFFQAVVKSALDLARERMRYVKIETASGEIIVLPGGTLVQPKFVGENSCRVLCGMPVKTGDIPVGVLPKNHRLQDTHTYPVESAESLVWQTALFSARGRVPADTDFSALVSLKAWPNMTRLLLFPHALRIAALWANLPYSLTETARVLRIRQRYVFAFFSAASALEMTSVKVRGSNARKTSNELKKRDGAGFLRRVLNRIQQIPA